MEITCSILFVLLLRLFNFHRLLLPLNIPPTHTLSFHLPSFSVLLTCNGKAIPLHAWTGPEGFRKLRLLDNRHVKLVRLSALRTGRFYPPGNIPGTYFS